MTAPIPGSVLQPWVETLSLMQQGTLMASVRGPDGIGKRHKVKPLIRFFRRSIFNRAFGGGAFSNPWSEGGGQFTGPSIGVKDLEGFGVWNETSDEARWRMMGKTLNDFVDSRDELPFHYYTHMMHGFEILGYKHPDPTIRAFWLKCYLRLVHALHVWPETEDQMDTRLGDDEAGWKARSDESSTCSE